MSSDKDRKFDPKVLSLAYNTRLRELKPLPLELELLRRQALDEQRAKQDADFNMSINSSLDRFKKLFPDFSETPQTSTTVVQNHSAPLSVPTAWPPPPGASLKDAAPSTSTASSSQAPAEVDYSQIPKDYLGMLGASKAPQSSRPATASGSGTKRKSSEGGARKASNSGDQKAWVKKPLRGALPPGTRQSLAPPPGSKPRGKKGAAPDRRPPERTPSEVAAEEETERQRAEEEYEAALAASSLPSDMKHALQWIHNTFQPSPHNRTLIVGRIREALAVAGGRDLVREQGARGQAAPEVTIPTSPAKDRAEEEQDEDESAGPSKVQSALSSLRELERVIEEQHRQLVHRGVLDAHDEEEIERLLRLARLAREGRPAPPPAPSKQEVMEELDRIADYLETGHLTRDRSGARSAGQEKKGGAMPPPLPPSNKGRRSAPPASFGAKGRDSTEPSSSLGPSAAASPDLDHYQGGESSEGGQYRPALAASLPRITYGVDGSVQLDLSGQQGHAGGAPGHGDSGSRRVTFSAGEPAQDSTPSFTGPSSRRGSITVRLAQRLLGPEENSDLHSYLQDRELEVPDRLSFGDWDYALDGEAPISPFLHGAERPGCPTPRRSTTAQLKSAFASAGRQDSAKEMMKRALARRYSTQSAAADVLAALGSPEESAALSRENSLDTDRELSTSRSLRIRTQTEDALEEEDEEEYAAELNASRSPSYPMKRPGAPTPTRAMLGNVFTTVDGRTSRGGLTSETESGYLPEEDSDHLVEGKGVKVKGGAHALSLKRSSTLGSGTRRGHGPPMGGPLQEEYYI